MNLKIYVGNLSYETSEEQFRAYFGQFGNVADIKLIRDFETGRSKGFGFVTYSSDAEVNDALKANGEELDGRKLKVNIAQENTQRARRPGGSGGRSNDRGGDRGDRGGNGDRGGRGRQ